MRPRVIIPVLALSLAALLAILVLRPDRNQTQAVSLPMPQTALPVAPARESVSASLVESPAPKLASPEADAGPAAETHEQFVARRTDEFMALAMTDDLNSLYLILAELNHSDPQIRQAAVSAAVQFGSPEAIPALRDAYGQLEDPEEKIGLKKAIEFLSLPSAAPTTALTN